MISTAFLISLLNVCCGVLINESEEVTFHHPFELRLLGWYALHL
jgi:hypothetical protein